MPVELKLDDDPAQYNVETPKGTISVNALELSAAIMAAGGTKDDTTPEQMSDAMKIVASGDAVKELDDLVLFALGCRVSMHFVKSGNVPES